MGEDIKRLKKYILRDALSEFTVNSMALYSPSLKWLQS